jgi:hypothetical protein
MEHGELDLFGKSFLSCNDGAQRPVIATKEAIAKAGTDCFLPLLGVASRYVVLKARLLPCANLAYNCFVRMVSHAMHGCGTQGGRLS